MTNFTKTRLTDKGLALLAKTGVSVTVTKVKTGNGEYQTDADIGAMTELKSEKQEFKITSTQKKTDTTYAIKFVMSNKELAEDYLFTEIGIYASDRSHHNASPFLSCIFRLKYIADFTA